MSKSYNNLIESVLEKSYFKTDWKNAVREWEIIDVEEDEDLESSCVCGKKGIKYLYTIKNKKTDEVLYPIGSHCIKKFGNKEMDEYTTITEKFFKLLHAIKENEFILLDSEFFNRKLLKDLYERGVFKPDEYNQYNSYRDYEFLLNMFNKRDKSLITKGQLKKVRGLIGFKIRPYLEDLLSSKIKKSR